MQKSVYLCTECQQLNLVHLDIRNLKESIGTVFISSCHYCESLQKVKPHNMEEANIWIYESEVHAILEAIDPNKKWKKDEISDMLLNNDKAVVRAVVAIHDRQTEDEKTDQATKHRNRVGFTGVDAKFCSSLADQVKAGKPLSDQQILAARKVIMKYAGQLTKIANKKI